MLKLNELRQNPIVFQIKHEGVRYEMTAARLDGGRVSLDCSCGKSDWCWHRLEALCETVLIADEKSRFSFEDIIGGTPLSDAAEEFMAAVQQFKDASAVLYGLNRPILFEEGVLDQFSVVASVAAEHAADTAKALSRFKRELTRGFVRAPK